MLISAAMPIMSFYRLPQGQYGYTGHVVNLPQDVTSFAHSLPWLPSDLDVIVVRKEGTNQTHQDFRSVVHRALQWLTSHNQYYFSMGVTIDATALEQLPHDGNVSHLVSVTEDCSTPDIPTTMTAASTCNTLTTSDATAVEDDHLSQSFVPVAAPSMTEQEAVQRCVQQRQTSSSSHPTLM